MPSTTSCRAVTAVEGVEVMMVVDERSMGEPGRLEEK